MDTDHLKIFAEVVRQGSFAAAARAMDIDPCLRGSRNRFRIYLLDS
jgi:hypothetical protein